MEGQFRRKAADGLTKRMVNQHDFVTNLIIMRSSALIITLRVTPMGEEELTMSKFPNFRNTKCGSRIREEISNIPGVRERGVRGKTKENVQGYLTMGFMPRCIKRKLQPH